MNPKKGLVQVPDSHLNKEFHDSGFSECVLEEKKELQVNVHWSPYCGGEPE